MFALTGFMLPTVLSPARANIPILTTKPQNTLVTALIDSKPHARYMTFNNDVLDAHSTQLMPPEALIEGKHSTWEFSQVCPTDFDYEMIKEWAIQQAVSESLIWMWNNGVIAMLLIWLMTLVVCLRLLHDN